MAGEVARGLDGRYTVLDVGPDAVTPGGAAGPSVVLSPRHRWLADSDGYAVDPWKICNVFADGAHITIGIVKPGTPPDDVWVELGS